MKEGWSEHHVNLKEKAQPKRPSRACCCITGGKGQTSWGKEEKSNSEKLCVGWSHSSRNLRDLQQCRLHYFVDNLQWWHLVAATRTAWFSRSRLLLASLHHPLVSSHLLYHRPWWLFYQKETGIGFCANWKDENMSHQLYKYHITVFGFWVDKVKN